MAAATSITLLEVPPDADEALLDGWRIAGGRLYRALRDDVDFRFVELSGADAGAPPPDRAAPFRAHASLYEVAHEDGAPDGDEGVVLINPFELPSGADEAFVAGWQRAREVLAAQRGYQGTRLHRAAGPARFRFVNVARWSSPLAFSKAVADPAFRAAAGALPFPSHPALYLRVPG